MSDLIDTTEMYLKTVYELVEEGIVPLRARIAERLGHSGPTVSQTVARMERDELLTVSGDRHLELTPEGWSKATAVMRKHRLAERLLTDVIGLDLAYVHEEACRWEHVMSEAVERKLVNLLRHPTTSPYGNPIPGLDKLGEGEPAPPPDLGLVRLDEFARSGGGKVEIRQIAEHAQLDESLMSELRSVGIVPGSTVQVGRASGGNTTTEIAGETSSVQVANSMLHAVLAQTR